MDSKLFLTNCSNICDYSDSILDVLKRAHKIISDNSSSIKERKRWVKLIDRSVRLCNEAIANSYLSTSACRK